METTHTQLYQLPGGLFLENAPIFISEGGLWQNKETAELFGRLQLKNIDMRTVQAVAVKLIPFATNGALLGDGVFHTYTPDAEPNGYFGADALLSLPENTCAFGACVTEVTFADGTAWTPENTRAWHVADEGYNPQAPAPKKKGLFR